MNKILLLLLISLIGLYGDQVYSQNKKANRLYEQGKYEEALKIYENALLESPGNKKLSMNKGSTHYKLDNFDKAYESYERAMTVEDEKIRADLLYNMGNVLNKQGDQLASSGNQQAMEKFKEARDSYIKSLDLNPHDLDAKWNLQLTQMKIKELEKQQQQQQQQKNDKNQKQNQDQQQQDQKQQDQKQQEQKQQDQQDQREQEKQEQEQKNAQKDEKQPEDKKEMANAEPKPEKSEEDLKKEEALRLLMQYADDAEDLNKPKKKVLVGKPKKSEKDW